MLTHYLKMLADRRVEVTNGKADFVIGRKDNPQVLRWYAIPRNRFFNVYVHLFLRSDQDFALHDHPWLFNVSLIWKGQYNELLPFQGNYQTPQPKLRTEGSTKFRWGKSPHRVELINEEPCWTIFLTGPKVRTWGFYCPKGWVRFLDIVKYKTNEGSEPMDGCP